MAIEQLRYSERARIVAFGIMILGSNACGGWWSPPAMRTPLIAPDAAPLASSTAAASGEGTIRFLEDRVRRDPEDFGTHNKLAALYLQRQRETGDTSYLALALRAAQASLQIVPSEMNTGALAALAQAEHAGHEFASARDHAQELIRLESGKSYPYLILGDALLELGDYEKADVAFREMEKRGGGVSTETRRARIATLHGAPQIAQRHLTGALALALDSSVPQPETVAWCRWQLGEAAHSVGDYEIAERHYRDALTTLPGYLYALAALGRVRAARGDLQSAIDIYEQVVRRLPDPIFVATLGDLYKVAGRAGEAAAQYKLVEQINRIGEANGALYNRQLALFYADHDMKPEEAYASARKEYAVRHDIYGADALAWTALKAGKLPEAQSAMEEALRLNTKDAKLFYHAGMIAHARNDKSAARDFLRRALTLNPQFDSLQSSIAQKILSSLS